MKHLATKSNILIVEDDQRLAQLLSQELSYEGHRVVKVHSGIDALLAAEETFDLIVLDLNLPDMDGVEVAERLRGRSEASILMLTARADIESKIKGLYAGASDYVTKPFSLQELVARIHVRLRERQKTQQILVYQSLELDSLAKVCRIEGRVLPLTSQEFRLLELFLNHSGRIFSKEDLETRLYSTEDLPGSNTIEVFISSLRKKLTQHGLPHMIQTVRGMGYLLR
jgi:DNA-binding response OmpR family regulator